jgi:hypothetical protein
MARSSGVEVPGVGGVDAVLELRLLVHDLVHLFGRQVFTELRVDGVVAVEQRLHFGDALLDVAADGLVGIECRFLRQVADADALSGEGLADEVGLDAGHDLEQRGLAGAVQAEHADLGPGQEREPDVLEDLGIGRIDLPEPLHRVNELRWHELTMISGSSQ